MELHITGDHLHKLLSAASGDVALLYLYLQSGNDPAKAGERLRFSAPRLSCAMATLRQLGLWEEKKDAPILRGECPHYSEQDVISAMDTDHDFQAIYGEVQRLLGRTMNTEELKILLGIQRYLGLPGDVVSVLICYCKDRARQRGSSRNPSLRTIEKEAYAWAEQGIDTVEEAAAYIQRQNVRRSRIGRLMQLLQIRGRSLTPGEEKYAAQWLSWGFDEEAISMAYERTCLNTGGLSWAYMNRILSRWQEKGLLTAEAIRSGDQKPAGKNPSGKLGQAELEAIRSVLEEG